MPSFCRHKIQASFYKGDLVEPRSRQGNHLTFPLQPGKALESIEDSGISEVQSWMLSGLDPSKMLPINGSSLPRWMLPGFDLNKLWPTRGDKNSTLVPYFLGGTIASSAAFAIRIFTTVFAGILIASPVEVPIFCRLEWK